MRDRFVVGRQPIFDEKLEVVAYKLMVGQSHPDPRVARDAVTGQGVEIDLDRLFGPKPVFVRADSSLLSDDFRVALPPGHAILEVPGETGNDLELLAACRALVDDGYELALDISDDLDPDWAILELASYVKLEVGFTSRDKIRAALKRCSTQGAKSIAKSVNTVHRVETFRDLGFDLFEGYLMSRPVARVDEALTPSRITCLHLIETVGHPDTTPADIERIVEAEPGLSYRLLHVSSLGSAGGLRRPVESISEAVVLLGRDRMYNWLILMLMADANRGTPEQLVIAMTRARMCRLMASSIDPRLEDSAYTVGLVSALDLLLGTNLNQVIANLAIADHLTQAVMNHSGILGLVLSDVLDWEQANQDMTLLSGLDLATAERHYLNALSWAVEMVAPLEVAAPLAAAS